MTEQKPIEITVTYNPGEKQADARCDFAAEEREERDERAEDLFTAVHTAVSEQLAEENLRVLSGDESQDEQNAVLRHYGHPDAIPTM
jgi:hypothetical protein